MDIAKKDFTVSLVKIISYLETDEKRDYESIDGISNDHIYLDIVKVRDYMSKHPDYGPDFRNDYYPRHLTVKHPKGEFVADSSTGNVVFKNIIDDAYVMDKKIKRFNLDEWKRYYNKDIPAELFVLDLGVWLEDGTYLPAKSNYREQKKE